MNPFITILLFLFTVVPATVASWLISHFAFDQTYGMSSIYSITIGFVLFWAIRSFRKIRYLRKHALTGKEYKYIKKNLHDANKKLQRLRSAFFKAKDITSFKQSVDTYRVASRIYRITKKEPKRFYQAEEFYYSHLDSLVEIAEKYAFLSTQPKKQPELIGSLHETRLTLKDLSRVVEEDLNKVLANDIDHLNYELDVVKYTLKTKDDMIDPDEKRGIK